MNIQNRRIDTEMDRNCPKWPCQKRQFKTISAKSIKAKSVNFSPFRTIQNGIEMTISDRFKTNSDEFKRF